MNKRIQRKALAVAVAAAFVGLPFESGMAANCTLTTNGTWGTASNWSCNVRPGTPSTVDTATINLGGVVQVTLQPEQILTLTNAGTVNITDFLLSLLAGGTTANTGTINVGSGVTAALQVFGGHNINNTGGVINVANGSVINQFGSTITGGTISTTGTGRLGASASAANFLSGVTLNGLLDMASATGFERITNGLTLGGTISLNNNSVLAFEGTNTVAGGGTIVLGSTGASNRIALDGTGTTTFAAGTTVRGENGTIGNNVFVTGTQALVNNGTISADVAGGTITIAGSPVTNNGTLSALNGGTLVLSSNVTGNPGGQIVAGAGSTVLQNAVTLAGTINTSGSGRFAATASGSNFLNGVTLNGNLDLATATGFERVTAGGLVLNGTINVNNNSVLAFNDVGGLSGNATIVLGSTGASNRIALDGTGTTTFAAGTTVRGENGTIGNNVFVTGTQALVNNGTISADVAGGTITIAGSPVTNNGTLSALNGGTLVLSSNVTGNPGGQIVAGAGSTVLQNGVTLAGTISTSGSGRFAATASGSNFLNGVTLNGNLDLATATANERVTAGGLVLNGTINVNNNSVLAFNDVGGLSGNATIVLGSTGAGNRIALDGNGTTTFAAGTTVRGHSGTIGNSVFVGGTQTLVNNGTISADVSGGTITIAGSPVTNNGTLSALNGGTLVLSSNVTGNPGGQIVAGAGSTVLQNAVTLAGTINTSGSGRFAATASGSNFLNGVTLNGNLDLATATAIERVTAGGLVLNGTINVNNNSVLAFNDVGGLSGNATIVLGSTGAGNRIALDGNGTTTFAAGTTVRGHSGTIGNAVFVGGTQTLVNNGTINADVAGGTITISGAPLVNNGLVRAQAGTIGVSSALTGTGTLQVDATGAMNLAAGAKSQGVLAMGATGAALNLNTGNLTISSDYTNVGAGTGNSFNRRAGVTGTGLIVTGGNAAQAITGATVTNGNTTNATLTINNVRVGTTTYDYQVANTGTTGPSLRGAIQTNVNGANLSDARLTGAGVTASNYNTGAPGSNTGNLGVTFTAASAGALAALSGQVLNLRSNFENIADQKLNIVLASGAAAYNAAVGNTGAATVANQRVGGSNSTALTVNNTAPAGGFTEVLNASFGANAGQATNNGASITGGLGTGGIAGGGADNTTMRVGVDTTAAGAKSGTVTLNYVTNGLGSSGLAPASVGSQVVNVSGNVYQVAQPAFGSTNVVFGNRHVGDAASQTVSITNTNVAPGFQEGLNASVSSLAGNATGSGSIANLAAGGSSNAISVGINTGSAGAKSGTVNVGLVSTGAGTSGLTDLSLGTQAVTVSGNVYRLAQANTIGPINFGNVLAGSTQTRTVSISNLAATDGFSEALNAAFGTIGGTNASSFSTSGSINGLLAGSTNNATMVVTLNTSTTGTRTANVQILLESNGTAIGNGLGITALPTQVINLDGVITGTVGNLATAGLNPTNVNFGKFREGQVSSQTQQLTVTNLTSGPGEGLNASFGANTGTASNNGGTITSLATGASNNTAMNVSLNGLATAGAKSGTTTLNFVSDGSFNGGTPTTLPSQTVNMNAEVYRLAQAGLPASVNLAARRVGDAAATGALNIANTAATDGFSEGLKGTIGAAPGGFSVSGPATTGLIAAGASESRSVSLSTAAAGTFGGNVNVALVSNGAGTSGFGDLSIGSANVAVNGKVYTAAVGQLASSTTINFGTVRVGSALAAQDVTISNGAANTALNDTLRGTLSVTGGGFSGNGATVGGLGAGQSNGSGTLAVGLSTAAAGNFNGTAQVAFKSQNGDMADLSLSPSSLILLNGAVNALANPVFGKTAGTGLFSGSGTSYTLDFGNLILGSGTSLDTLFLQNLVSGPADDLLGSFSLAGLGVFADGGFGTVNLSPNAIFGGLNLSFTASSLGLFNGSFTFSGLSHNAFQSDLALADITVFLRANVIASGGTVPEPGTLLLLALALIALRLAQRRRAR